MFGKSRLLYIIRPVHALSCSDQDDASHGRTPRPLTLALVVLAPTRLEKTRTSNFFTRARTVVVGKQDAAGRLSSDISDAKVIPKAKASSHRRCAIISGI
jgi:hypothetical protein